MRGHLAPALPASVTSASRPESVEFLEHCAWGDVVWTFSPTNALEKDKPVRIRWDFELPSGAHFTDNRFAPLLEASRRFIATVRRCGSATGLAQRATTVQGLFNILRWILCFMDANGFIRFADLDAGALKQLQHSLERRTTRGHAIARVTVRRYLDVLVYLHRYRDTVGDGLRVHPCSGQSTGALAGVRNSDRGRLPYTPEPVALALIRGAIDYLSSSALDLLRAREACASAVATAKRRSGDRESQRQAAIRALHGISVVTPKGPRILNSTADLDELVNLLYTACFIVISYLVGLRSSEILQLRVGCVRSWRDPRSGEDTGLAEIVGAIFKHEAAFDGRPHRWPAAPPAVHAISVLEALSAPLRARTGRSELWLRTWTGHACGEPEWDLDCQDRVRVLPTMDFRYLLKSRAIWFELPPHDGKPWRLSTHQGRKTFARFAALRDRTGLFALAKHLGHRDRAITNYGYAGTDYRLNEEIDAAVLEQSVAGWEEMLSAKSLGGRAGTEILAQRPRFLGSRIKQDLKSYAKMLVDAGLTLGVCDWGFCVYRQPYSACLGSKSEPNPIRREPSTCASCRNFSVSEKHRGYWLEQARRSEALLNEPALPTQTLKIARERLNEALAVVRSIDGSGE